MNTKKKGKTNKDKTSKAQAYNLWEGGEENRLWKELAQKIATYPLLTRTSSDFNDYYEPFLEGLHHLVEIMKQPHKSKGYDQSVLRSWFFAQTDQSFIKRIDGEIYEIPKAMFDIAADWRRAFMDVWEDLEIVYKIVDTNYVSERAKFVKLLDKFDKMYMKQNTANKNIAPMLDKILSPITDAMVANYNLYSLEVRAHKKKQWFKQEAPDFRTKACTASLIRQVTKLITLLVKHGPIDHVPDLNKCFAKQEIPIANSVPVHYFIMNLRNSWSRLRAALQKKYKATINRWKWPLAENTDIIVVIQDLLEQDDLWEKLVGTALKKDQLEAMYKIIKHIYDSPMKDRLLQHADVWIIETIPTLAVFIGCQQLAQEKRKQALNERQAEELKQEFGIDLEETKQSLTHSSSLASFFAADIVAMEKATKEANEVRMWIWDDYIPQELKLKWEKLAFLISRINVTVQEDVVDYIIAQNLIGDATPRSLPKGYTPRIEEQKLRPPYCWNYMVSDNDYLQLDDAEYKKLSKKREKKGFDSSISLKPVRKFRSHVNPTKWYVDNRVERVIEKSFKLAALLREAKPDSWQLLISEIVKIFQNPLPQPFEDVISTDEEQIDQFERMRMEVESPT